MIFQKGHAFLEITESQTYVLIRVFPLDMQQSHKVVLCSFASLTCPTEFWHNLKLQCVTMIDKREYFLEMHEIKFSDNVYIR